MSNPLIPAGPPLGPIPPPLLQLPWGTVGARGEVILTPSAYGFLQLMWSALQGGGGVIDQTIEGTPSPGALAAVLQALRPFGVTFTCQDIAGKPPSTVVARAPAGIAWDMPVGLAHSCGKVTTAPIADTAFDLQVDGVSVGTATWASGSTIPTFTKAAATIVRETDFLDLVTPANLHGMAGAFGLTIMGAQR